MAYSVGRWSGGLAEWVDGDTAYLSIAFTWRLDDAYSRACWYRQMGLKVRAGGPGIFTRKHYLTEVAEIGGDVPDALVRHNPMATIASRGCPVGCWFCIVPKMEGREFTLLPDFPVRPVLCDNNLSALPPDYQQHIVDRYRASGMPLLDANSGFEPRTFDEEVFARWRPVNRGPWRFAYDDMGDRPHVERVMRMLGGVSPRKKQVYVLIGNEPKEACMQRIQEVIGWGGEPYAQPFMKLNALQKVPHVRHDWTLRELKAVQRWVNARIWRKAPFSEYDASLKTANQMPIVDPGFPGLFDACRPPALAAREAEDMELFEDLPQTPLPLLADERRMLEYLPDYGPSHAVTKVDEPDEATARRLEKRGLIKIHRWKDDPIAIRLTIYAGRLEAGRAALKEDMSV